MRLLGVRLASARRPQGLPAHPAPASVVRLLLLTLMLTAAVEPDEPARRRFPQRCRRRARRGPARHHPGRQGRPPRPRRQRDRPGGLGAAIAAEKRLDVLLRADRVLSIGTLLTIRERLAAAGAPPASSLWWYGRDHPGAAPASLAPGVRPGADGPCRRPDASCPHPIAVTCPTGAGHHPQGVALPTTRLQRLECAAGGAPGVYRRATGDSPAHRSSRPQRQPTSTADAGPEFRPIGSRCAASHANTLGANTPGATVVTVSGRHLWHHRRGRRCRARTPPASQGAPAPELPPAPADPPASLQPSAWPTPNMRCAGHRPCQAPSSHPSSRSGSSFLVIGSPPERSAPTPPPAEPGPAPERGAILPPLTIAQRGPEAAPPPAPVEPARPTNVAAAGTDARAATDVRTPRTAHGSGGAIAPPLPAPTTVSPPVAITAPPAAAVIAERTRDQARPSAVPSARGTRSTDDRRGPEPVPAQPRMFRTPHPARGFRRSHRSICGADDWTPPQAITPPPAAAGTAERAQRQAGSSGGAASPRAAEPRVTPSSARGHDDCRFQSPPAAPAPVSFRRWPGQGTAAVIELPCRYRRHPVPATLAQHRVAPDLIPRRHLMRASGSACRPQPTTSRPWPGPSRRRPA